MIGRVNTGGGGSTFAFIIANYPEGAACTCSNGLKTLRAKDTSGSWVFDIPYAGAWTVSTDASHSKTVTIAQKGEAKKATIILPNTYQQVNYLQASGTQWIRTSVSGKNNLSFYVKFYVNEAITKDLARTVFGARQEYNQQAYQLSMYTSTTPYDGSFAYGALDYSNTKLGVVAYSAQEVSFDGDTRTLTKATGSTQTLTSQSTFTTPHEIYLFAMSNASGTAEELFKGRIYSVIFSEGDTVTANYVPCYRINDSAAGMYDLVSENFCTNQGSGTFAVGNDVP